MPSSKAPLFPPMTPFPRVYFCIFAYFEVGITLVGALYVLLAPERYFNETLPGSFSGELSRGGPRTNMLMAGLGSCFIVIALLECFLIQTLQRLLRNQAVLHERILEAFLCALSLGDILHVVLTIAFVPVEMRFDLTQWNAFLFGNVGLVVAIFLARCAWFKGIGRTSYRDSVKLNQGMEIHKKEEKKE